MIWDEKKKRKTHLSGSGGRNYWKGKEKEEQRNVHREDFRIIYDLKGKEKKEKKKYISGSRRRNNWKEKQENEKKKSIHETVV